MCRNVMTVKTYSQHILCTPIILLENGVCLSNTNNYCKPNVVQNIMNIIFKQI